MISNFGWICIIVVAALICGLVSTFKDVTKIVRNWEKEEDNCN